MVEITPDEARGKTVYEVDEESREVRFHDGTYISFNNYGGSTSSPSGGSSSSSSPPVTDDDDYDEEDDLDFELDDDDEWDTSSSSSEDISSSSSSSSSSEDDGDLNDWWKTPKAQTLGDKDFSMSCWFTIENRGWNIQQRIVNAVSEKIALETEKQILEDLINTPIEKARANNYSVTPVQLDYNLVDRALKTLEKYGKR